MRPPAARAGLPFQLLVKVCRGGGGRGVALGPFIFRTGARILPARGQVQVPGANAEVRAGRQGRAHKHEGVRGWYGTAHPALRRLLPLPACPDPLQGLLKAARERLSTF